MRLIVLLLISAFYAFASIGYISAMSGEISLIRDGKPQKPYAGFLLENGDKIDTRSDARVQLIFDDETVITLGKNSSFTIDEVDFASRDQKAKFSVAKGTFKAMTGKIAKTSPKSFELKGRTSTIGIRGTHFQGNISDQGDTIACTDGAIIVSSQTHGGVVTVNAGEFTTVAPNQTPTPPQSYSSTDLDSVGADQEAEATEEPAADQPKLEIADQVRDVAETVKDLENNVFKFYGYDFYANGKGDSDHPYNMPWGRKSYQEFESITPDVVWGKATYALNSDSVRDEIADFPYLQTLFDKNPLYVEYFAGVANGAQVAPYSGTTSAIRIFNGKVAGGVYLSTGNQVGTVATIQDMGEIITSKSSIQLNIDFSTGSGGISGSANFETTKGSKWNVPIGGGNAELLNSSFTAFAESANQSIEGTFFGNFISNPSSGADSVAGTFELTKETKGGIEFATGVFVAK